MCGTLAALVAGQGRNTLTVGSGQAVATAGTPHLANQDAQTVSRNLLVWDDEYLKMGALTSKGMSVSLKGIWLTSIPTRR